MGENQKGVAQLQIIALFPFPSTGSSAASLTEQNMIWPNGEASYDVPDTDIKERGVPHSGWHFQQQWEFHVDGKVMWMPGFGLSSFHHSVSSSF